MGQSGSRAHTNGRPRLKRVHAIYLYGSRGEVMAQIIDQLKQQTYLDRANIQELIRQLRTLHTGLRSDNAQLNLNRMFESALLHMIEYLQFEPDLQKTELKQFIVRLTELRKAHNKSFQKLYNAFEI